MPRKWFEPLQLLMYMFVYFGSLPFMYKKMGIEGSILYLSRGVMPAFV